ncbi:hypothetical protein K8P10_000722 [Leucobacter sp. Psy1]|nr:hypothetical protein K8P10_000722 [Leucobacter sp. Psy1]
MTEYEELDSAGEASEGISRGGPIDGGDPLHRDAAPSPESEPTREVKLMADYAAAIPLWVSDGMLSDESILPPKLRAELHSWSDIFDEHFDPETGWPSLEMCQAQYAEGLRLLDVLSDHFGPEVDVTYDFWECCVRGEDIPLSRLGPA